MRKVQKKGGHWTSEHAVTQHSLVETLQNQYLFHPHRTTIAYCIIDETDKAKPIC
jgi:hypothetical protein